MHTDLTKSNNLFFRMIHRTSPRESSGIAVCNGKG